MAVRLLKTLFQAAALTALMLPVTAAAQAVFNGGGLAAGAAATMGLNFVAEGTLDGVINSAIARVIPFAGLAAAIVIVIAGFYLILGLGDDGSKDKAKKIILYTIIGLGVIIFSIMIVNFALYIYGEGPDPGVQNTVLAIIERVVNFVALLATIVIIIAGFYLILGLGDEGSKDKAKKIILYTIVGILLIGFASIIVSTVYYVMNGGGVGGDALKQQVGQMVSRVLNFLAFIAVITVIIAGIYLIVSLGNEENKERAKKIIIYTLMGLLVVLFARIIVGLVTNIVAGATGYIPPSGIIAFLGSA